MTSNEHTGRSAEIATIIRERIIHGELHAGERLPTYPELEAQFQTSRATLHGAIQILKEQEFIDARGRLGMSVCLDLPHLRRVALAMPLLPKPNLFLDALTHAAQELSQAGGVAIEVIDDVDQELETPAYQRLLDGIQNHRYGGLMFVHEPRYLREALRLHARTGLPVVSLGGSIQAAQYHQVVIDNASFYEQAFSWFRARCRQRVATVLYKRDGLTPEQIAQAKAMGVDTPQDWQIGLDVLTPLSVERVIRLLFRDPSNRPDGILILDDHHVTPVCKAILSFTGLRIGDKLDILSLGNWPNIPATPLPIAFLGYSSTEIVSRGLSLVQHGLRGGATRCENVRTYFISDPSKLDRPAAV